jgi:hypothetical protein
MPGFDGTGPMGQGPMTGGGRGFCSVPYRGYSPYGYGMRQPYAYPPAPPYPIYGPVFGAGRGGLPWGGGRGRVFGGGRGFRRRWW